jgi:hypothetical protein
VIQRTVFKNVRFQVLTAASIVVVDRRFRGAYFIIRAIALMMDTVRTTEMSVYNETTRRNIPEEYYLRYLRNT